MQRSQRLKAWLASHRQQLRGLQCGLPPDFFSPRPDWRADQAAALRAARPALVEVLWEHRTALASLVLSGSQLDAAVAAAAASSGAEAASGLAQCTALASLTVFDYKGPADALAALVAPLSSLSHLELCDTRNGWRRAARSPAASCLQAWRQP